MGAGFVPPRIHASTRKESSLDRRTGWTQRDMIAQDNSRQMDNRPLVISAVMATCNGARFLPQQLASIARQTRLPDELIVGDDASTDATRDIIRAFAESNPKIDVRLHENPTRLGSTVNFDATVRRARGEILVFSDQDDEWLPHRIERLAAALEIDPQASYAFSDGILIDETGRAVGGSLFSTVDFGARERRWFSAGGGLRVLMRRNVVTGAALAVRRSMLELLLPFERGWIHDYYMALVLEALGHGVVIEEPLIRYRLHSGQQISVAKSSLGAAWTVARRQTPGYCLAEAERFGGLVQRLTALGVSSHHEVFALAHAKVEFIRVRARMRQHPLEAPFLIARELFRNSYRRYSQGWKQAVVDLLAAMAG